jgi:ribosome-binding protein aMBF1 (putative translation factor)
MECTEEGQPAAPDPDDTRFGERLKAIRKRRGLTQVELAERLGIHPSLIAHTPEGSCPRSFRARRPCQTSF